MVGALVVFLFVTALLLFFRYLARVAYWAAAIKPSKWFAIGPE